MDERRARSLLARLERQGKVEALQGASDATARTCVDRAEDRLSAAEVLIGSEHWETAFTTAYDGYRMAAEAVVLATGHRVPAVAGAHAITFDIARAALGSSAEVFGKPTADRFRRGRHDSEYFDPERPAEKTEADAAWAVEKATAAVEAVRAALG
jgi:uncharacterized protein (UPF0332 family)